MEAPGSTQGPKADLSQRSQELRVLVALQEQGGKIFAQSCEEKLRQNRELLPSLQAALQEDSSILDFVLKVPADPSCCIPAWCFPRSWEHGPAKGCVIARLTVTLSLSLPCPQYNKLPIKDAFGEGQELIPATQRASCRDRAVPLLSDNIPIWALIDLLIPSPGLCYAQPCHQQLPTSASPQPAPRAKLSQIPSCQTSDNILEQRPSVPSSTLGGVFQAAPPSPAASSLGNALMPIQAVQKKIEAKIHDQVKVCDMLLHQLKQWSQARDERQRHLQELEDAETDPKWQEPQLQTIRQLGNDIEKMVMKIHSGQIVTNLYLKLQENLRRELVYLPQYLDLLCGMTVMYHDELTARSNLKANDVLRKLMAEAGPQVRVEKQLRDQSLAEQRMQIESLRQQEESKRQQRRQAVSMLSAEHELSSSETAVGAEAEAAVAKREREAFVTDKMEKAKSALQCSCLWDIPSSIQAQKKSLESLQQHIDECRERKKVLKKTLQELELKQAKLKFNQPISTIRCCWPRTELSENLQQEEARLEQMRAQMLRNQKRLIEFENIIDNLFLRLQGIFIPDQDESVAVVGLEEKLQHCEQKMQFLKERVAARPKDSTDERSEVRGSGPLCPWGHTQGPHRWPPKPSVLSRAAGKGHGAAQPQRALGTQGVPKVVTPTCPPALNPGHLSQTFAKVRNLLEKRTAGETQNLKISFEDEDTMEDDTLDFEDEDHDYIPSREDIKKQGLQLIRMNTRRRKKK
ncbi:LOW QUALITY PROTEIN: coiled-coil domain-containing protein 183 [Corvus hawaiiensis]|uniref:LOW QUALITY PROTEIN: coiled-coil domain-containing protein 183 n=1 Tax=Corvus hawaiiensis TaxID=134902 RepID=UPI002019525F|nr:LOW QUALITY PROTEIN: coiled-coil domain-containing protein 183 [Corvus hawaiiensis]